MTTTKKPRELPQEGGSYKRAGGGSLRKVEGSTKDAPPYHQRANTAATTGAKPKGAKTTAPKPKRGRPATKAKGGAATAAVAQNTTGSDTAGGANA